MRSHNLRRWRQSGSQVALRVLRAIENVRVETEIRDRQAWRHGQCAMRAGGLAGASAPVCAALTESRIARWQRTNIGRSAPTTVMRSPQSARYRSLFQYTISRAADVSFYTIVVVGAKHALGSAKSGHESIGNWTSIIARHQMHFRGARSLRTL